MVVVCISCVPCWDLILDASPHYYCAFIILTICGRVPRGRAFADILQPDTLRKYTAPRPDLFPATLRADWDGPPVPRL